MLDLRLCLWLDGEFLCGTGTDMHKRPGFEQQQPSRLGWLPLDFKHHRRSAVRTCAGGFDLEGLANPLKGGFIDHDVPGVSAAGDVLVKPVLQLPLQIVQGDLEADCVMPLPPCS